MTDKETTNQEEKKPENESIQSFQCDYCTFQAKTKEGLENHINVSHEGKEVMMHRVYDLNIKTDKQAQELVAYMKNLKQNAGWIIVRQMLEGNMALLEQAIINKETLGGAPASEDEVDRMRDQRSIFEQTIEKPEDIIKTLEGSKGSKTPNYDPYATDMRQFDPDSGTGDNSPMAATLSEDEGET